MVVGMEMIGVILHERRAALEAARHDFHRAEQRGGLPVAFGAEAVTIGHQALDARPGNCFKPCKSSNVVVKPLKLPFAKKCAQAEFDARAVAEGFVTLAAFLQIPAATS